MLNLIIDLLKKFFIKESIPQKNKHKVVVVYTKINRKTKMAEGMLYFQDRMVRIVSGGYGRGLAPKGDYRSYQIVTKYEEAYTMFGLGWAIGMELVKLSKDNTKEDKERSVGMTGICIHPDGNVKGSLGCIVCQFDDLKHNQVWHRVFEQYFKDHKTLEVEIC